MSTLQYTLSAWYSQLSPLSYKLVVGLSLQDGGGKRTSPAALRVPWIPTGWEPWPLVDCQTHHISSHPTWCTQLLVMVTALGRQKDKTQYEYRLHSLSLRYTETSCNGWHCEHQAFCNALLVHYIFKYLQLNNLLVPINPYRTAFPYGNGMVLHFYQQQESSTTKTVHKVINKGLKTYV